MERRRVLWLGVFLGLLGLLFSVPSRTNAQPGDSDKVELSLAAAPTLEPGKPSSLTILIRIAPGYHIQSNKPAPNYIPTVLALSGSGLKFGEPQFPPSETATVAGESIPVFSGTVRVRVPVTVEAGTTGRVSLKVTCSYQACDEGSCYPPTEISREFALTVGASAGEAREKPSAGTSEKQGIGETPPAQEEQVAEPEPPPTPTTAQAPLAPTPGARETGATEFAGYAMAKITQFVGPEEFVRFLEGGDRATGGQAGRLAGLLAAGNLLLALPLIFVLGLALNLTPCVYPIIPITISYFGSQAGTGRKPLGLALLYVLGMAVTYSALGVVAGMTGGLFGAQLQNPWVLLAFALVMFALALSQFDRPDGRPIWELQLPAGLRDRAQARSGWLGAVLMGVMVGVVAAPCIGPAVIALLQWVSMQQDPALGFAVFFTLALGLGTPYIFLATASGSVSKLPRAGEWMIGVKHIFGAVLLWMGFYYLRTPAALLHPAVPKVMMVTVTALLALYLLVLDRAGAGLRWFLVTRRLIGLGAAALAIWLALPAPAEAIRWKPYSEETLKQAMADRKAILIDFTAEWCAACKELEHKTFSDERVGQAARDFVALRADMTNFQGPQAKQWQKTYGISGLPTVVRLTPK